MPLTDNTKINFFDLYSPLLLKVHKKAQKRSKWAKRAVICKLDANLTRYHTLPTRYHPATNKNDTLQHANNCF